MKKMIKYVAPWLSAAAIGGAIALAPLASAASTAAPVPHNNVITTAAPSPSGEDPLVPEGTDPRIAFQNGYYNPMLPNDSGNANPGGGVGLPS
jgi:hypothetical protein